MDLPLNEKYVAEAFGTGDVATPEGTVKCFTRTVADLVLPTGHIVACDPLVFPETEPFTFTVTPGNYPVVLAIAQFGDGDQRVAFAKVQFSEKEATAWQMATVPGQDTATLGPGDIFGYAVDAGTGCFMDEAASRLLMERMKADEEYYQTLIDTMEKTYVTTWSWASVLLSERRAENCVVFSSGWGDGFYPSYFGFSAEGDVVCLVTDFDVLWREDQPVADSIKPKPWWKFW